jgi:hypothetical protein
MRQFGSRGEMLSLVPKGGACCEVGVFALDFSRQIATICQPSRLVLIDLFPAFVFSCDEHGGNPRTFGGERLLEEAVAFARSRSGVEVHCGPSRAVLKNLSGVMDFVYIDADHSYDGCTADLEEAWLLLDHGGWLAGHDYSLNLERVVDPSHYQHFGVKQAVDDFCDRHAVQIAAIAMDGYTSFAIRKPPL